MIDAHHIAIFGTTFENQVSNQQTFLQMKKKNNNKQNPSLPNVKNNGEIYMYVQ